MNQGNFSLIKNLLEKYVGWFFVATSILFVAVLLVRAYQRVGEVERDNITKQINLNLENGIQARFYLSQETGKPEILTADNYPILNFGAKDSLLLIDGQNFPLWDQVFNYSVDRRKKKFFYTVSTPEDKLQRSYILEQIVNLTDKNTIDIDYYFVWGAPVQVNQEVKQVDLNLAHFNSGLGNLGAEGQKIRGQTQITARRSENPNIPNSYVPFELELSNTLVDKDLSFTKTDVEIKPGFITKYRIMSPERGKRTFLAHETLKLGKSYP